MFDGIEKNRGLLLGTYVGAIILGILCFIPVFFISLIFTIPFSRWYWAGDGQAALGGIGLSFWAGIVGSITACIVFLKKASSRR